MINSFTKFNIKKFSSAQPFPHIVIDNLFNDDILNEMITHYPTENNISWWKYDNVFEKKLAYDNVSKLHDSFQSYFNYVNSLSFVKQLEKLTGIESLIADPSLRGGGLHRIKKGGKLDIHADFNYHKITGWERRLNMITFLNEGWQEGYGGHTEFWSKDMTKCVAKILPIFNRTVIFEVGENAWHGHPHPLSCPENTERRSLATYYYTQPDQISDNMEFVSTNYQKLPNEKYDQKLDKLRELRRKGRLKDFKT
jgi:Rps23 Pro-64 3,4-dihydroxylase Tpa1-like proline 4-hydroxylase